MNNMDNEKVQHLLNRLNNSYDNMVMVVKNPDHKFSEQAMTSNMATIVAIGLARNCVGYLNGDIESIDEAMEKAIMDAQKIILEEE